MRVLANFEKQLELLRKKRIVVIELEPEEWKCFDERPASSHDFGPAFRKQIERCELLKHAHGIGRTQNGDGARKSDTAGSDGGGGEDHSRRGVKKLTPVVFADTKHIEAHFISERDCFEQLAEIFRGIDGAAGQAVDRRRYETIYANLHTGGVFKLGRAVARAQRRRSGRSERRRSTARSR